MDRQLVGSLIPNIPFLLSVIFILLAVYYARMHFTRPFPPGPRSLPLIGAFFSIPKEHEWLTYSTWTRRYGPIIGVTVFGQKIVILSRPELVTELLEIRGALYSDRPSFTMLKLMGYGDWNVGLMDYGNPKLRLGRRLLSQAMTPQMISKYGSIQRLEVCQLLQNLSDSPKLFSQHLRRAIGGVISMVFFGHRVKRTGEDSLIALNDEAIINSSQAGSPAAYLVNTFPALQYLPAWFPGASFKREAKEGRLLAKKIYNLPVELMEQDMENGTAVSSFLSSLFEKKVGVEHIAAGQAAAATSYAAGIDTTTSTLATFILAMALYPAAQRRAQIEIDRTIGQDRLPNPEDKTKLHLPFIDAVIKETFRWNPSGPLGLPHRLTQDDVIQGYTLPRGTIVLSNVWAILHDEERFEKPYQFLPERFLHNTELEDPRIHAFGYGRRVCPGRNLAESTLWLAIVSILSVFEIAPDHDEKGKEVPISVSYTSGIMIRPKDFRCRITPRSKKTMHLLKLLADTFNPSDVRSS